VGVLCVDGTGSVPVFRASVILTVVFFWFVLLSVLMRIAHVVVLPLCGAGVWFPV
jgi:hypothetical protein